MGSNVSSDRSEENQHYVPKFLLKRFKDTDGQVYCLDIKTKSVTKLPPKKAASEDGFYEFPVGGEILTLEDRLQKLENVAARGARIIVGQASVGRLSAKDRERIGKFVGFQSIRTNYSCVGFAGCIGRQFGKII